MSPLAPEASERGEGTFTFDNSTDAFPVRWSRLEKPTANIHKTRALRATSNPWDTATRPGFFIEPRLAADRVQFLDTARGCGVLRRDGLPDVRGRLIVDRGRFELSEGDIP